jgi:hypothetical protein
MGIKCAYTEHADFAVNERRGAPELTISKRSRLWSSNYYEETGELG